MKNSFYLFILFPFAINAQNWNGTTVPATISDGYATHFQLTTSGWGGHHAILFNAYPSAPQVDGNLEQYGNTKHTYDVGPYSSGAGAIMFLGNGGNMDFLISNNSPSANVNVNWGVPKMTINRNGNVGIGNANSDAKLTVTGQVHAQEVKVSVTAPGPDYVLENDYPLSSLEEIKNYIDQNKHLPEVPSAKEMEKNGVQLGEMNMLLLKKIEELTLYQIDANRKIEILQREIQNLKK